MMNNNDDYDNYDDSDRIISILWKVTTLIASYAIGYSLHQIYPSWIFIWIHYARCLIALYFLWDLLLEDPKPFPQQPQHSSSIQPVCFSAGTKFHGLPRPMTCREKQDFVQHRFNYLPSSSSSVQQQQKEQRSSQQRDNILITAAPPIMVY
jgi:hypothetical protein